MHRSLSRRWRLVPLLALLALAVPEHARAAGPNIAPNAGFEDSVVEPAPVEPYQTCVESPARLCQPVLPAGWIFEGAAGFYDHSMNFAHSGRRAVGISIPAGGKRRVCAEAEQVGQLGCVDNPVTPLRPQFEWIYTVNPHWRTAQPVPVTPGATYTLSVWTSGELITAGEGLITKVRWVNALGVPISESAGPSRMTDQYSPTTLPWQEIAGQMTAPADATGAILFLGHSDDVWISQARFDDVYFGAS